METLTATSAAAMASSHHFFSAKSKDFLLLGSRRPFRFPIASKSNGNESDLRSDSDETSLVPILRNHTFSKDDAMGLVLSAMNVRGWTTGSGMEGPAAGGGSELDMEKISTFPWSLFTKSPRRRMRVAFTCNVCGQRTTRAINPHAYTDGTVFVQCCGCNVFHKLVDNLNLFHEMKCYVNPSFNYQDPDGGVSFKYLDMDDDDDDDNNDIFPLL